MQVGKELADLYVNYDAVEPWPTEFENCGWRPAGGIAGMGWFRVGKPMQHPRHGKAKDRTHVHFNDYITFSGILEEAYGYVVNGIPAIAWVLEPQRVKPAKASGIAHEANRCALEACRIPPLRTSY